MKRHIRNILSLLLISSTTFLFFQNCSSNVSFGGKNVLVLKGNGNSYDGKLKDGIYYRRIPDFKCDSSPAIHSHVEVKGEDIVTRVLNHKTCGLSAQPVALQELEFSTYGPALGYKDGVYERLDTPPDPDATKQFVPDVFCRSPESVITSGVDVIARVKTSTNEVKLDVYSSDAPFSASLPATRQNQGELVIYKSSDLQLKIDLSRPNEVGGSMEGQVGGKKISSQMKCRVAGLLDSQRAPGPLACPAGFVKSSAVPGFAENDFCLAKYEAKQAAPTSGFSVPQGVPWTNLTRVSAREACTSLGSRFDLPSNNEWQATARAIEANTKNWFTGVLNQGLYAGTAPAAASSNDEEACFGTKEDCDLNTWASSRRAHQLPSGEWIWDLSGNAAEWVSTDNYVGYALNGPISVLDRNMWQEVFQSFGPLRDYASSSESPYAGLGRVDLEGGNLLINTRDFSSPAWYEHTLSPVIETDVSSAPDGTLTADHVGSVTDKDFLLHQHVTLAADVGGRTFTFSIWVKGQIQANLPVVLHVGESNNWRANTRFGEDVRGNYTDWTRLSFTGTIGDTTSGPTVEIGLGMDNIGDYLMDFAGTDVDFWGAELIEASLPSAPSGIVRGGSVYDPRDAAGVFSTRTGRFPAGAYPDVGFRCVYHP